MRLLRNVCLSVFMIIAGCATVFAQAASNGIREPLTLPPFDPTAPKCAAPSNLEKVLAFAQDNEREFMQGVSRGLKMAASDRGMRYRVVLADNDGPRMISQIEELRNEKVGALVVAPIDPASLAPTLRTFIGSEDMSERSFRLPRRRS